MWPKVSQGNVPFAWQLFWVRTTFYSALLLCKQRQLFSSVYRVSGSRWLDRKLLLIVWQANCCVKRRDLLPCCKGRQLEGVERTIVCAMSGSLSSKEF